MKEKMVYIGFYLEEIYDEYMKRYIQHHRASFSKKSQVIRHCIKKQLPILLNDIALKIGEEE